MAFNGFSASPVFNTQPSSYHDVTEGLRPLEATHKPDMRRALPFLEVGIVLGVMLVTGLLQGVVEQESVFFINVNWSQVGAPTKPPLLGAWNTQEAQGEGNKPLISH